MQRFCNCCKDQRVDQVQSIIDFLANAWAPFIVSLVRLTLMQPSPQAISLRRSASGTYQHLGTVQKARVSKRRANTPQQILRRVCYVLRSLR
jgi:hypothetical protein